MPELPEVETIKNQLSDHLPFVIDEFELSPVVDSILKEREFDPTGMTISKITRRGKLMTFHFQEGGEDVEKYFLSHLGMSGTWLISNDPITLKHTHVLLKGHVNGEERYFGYNDPRRFGYLYWVKEESRFRHLKKLGPDIYDPEFTEEYLWACLKKYPDRKLKVGLLDQKLFAGIGNYLANEICAHAGIRPTRKFGKVTKKELPLLYKAFFESLDPSIKTGGVTFSGGYKDAYGESGEGVLNLVVFHQELCQKCKYTKVKKIVLAQRGTFYCPKCQK